jgi:predicted transcriptional regulator
MTKSFVTATKSFVICSRMTRKPPSKPTPSEHKILRVLWERGPSTVRQVLQACGPKTGYTTALKLLQIMNEKGLVSRDETQRPQVYRAVKSEEQTQKQIVRGLLDSVFRGSAKTLVMQALSSEKASAADLSEIRQLLDKLEEGSR